MVTAALGHKIPTDGGTRDPIFGLRVPDAVPGVPTELLTPRNTWTDTAAFDRQAAKLSEMFRENFRRYQDEVSEAVRAAAPRA